MMTEAQLNAKNKGQVVNYALSIQRDLEAATAEPLTAAGLERKVLELKRKVISVKDNAIRRKQEYETTLTKIKSDTDIKIKELELEYSSSDAVETKELIELIKTLESQANKAKEDLTFGLKEAETSHKEELAKLENMLTKETEKVGELISKLNAELFDKKEETKKELEKIKISHSRDMEQLEYNNSLAIRDANLVVATKIAKENDLALISLTELNTLKTFKATEETKVATMLEEAINKAKSDVHRIEGAKFSSLKAESENTIKLLENDKIHLQDTNNNLLSQVTKLETQLAKVPEQIKEAVAASKANIQVTQDANKK
jgi:hypothetical protein